MGIIQEQTKSVFGKVGILPSAFELGALKGILISLLIHNSIFFALSVLYNSHEYFT
jgi:hypothetical protein